MAIKWHGLDLKLSRPDGVHDHQGRLSVSNAGLHPSKHQSFLPKRLGLEPMKGESLWRVDGLPGMCDCKVDENTSEELQGRLHDAPFAKVADLSDIQSMGLAQSMIAAPGTIETIHDSI